MFLTLHDFCVLFIFGLCFLGYLKIVKCLLNQGATTALLDSNGHLFSVTEFEGVWNEIASHRQKHSDIIMSLIEKDSKHNIEKLKKVWVVRILISINFKLYFTRMALIYFCC